MGLAIPEHSTRHARLSVGERREKRDNLESTQQAQTLFWPSMDEADLDASPSPSLHRYMAFPSSRLLLLLASLFSSSLCCRNSSPSRASCVNSRLLSTTVRASAESRSIALTRTQRDGTHTIYLPSSKPSSSHLGNSFSCLSRPPLSLSSPTSSPLLRKRANSEKQALARSFRRFSGDVLEAQASAARKTDRRKPREIEHVQTQTGVENTLRAGQPCALASDPSAGPNVGDARPGRGRASGRVGIARKTSCDEGRCCATAASSPPEPLGCWIAHGAAAWQWWCRCHRLCLGGRLVPTGLGAETPRVLTWVQGTAASGQA
ncbi:hypothetical protein TPAR_07509 [Tolypocladium paradoxum]|uniref:Uncharacterized protein n=1 Tax=Tolypocladium paradoxum TaxID=94208 RepID=A0A2S4KQ12_9HYPO|nr:hypothetical protein TPAR_07509 [Tolypocladium paradoxum]